MSTIDAMNLYSYDLNLLTVFHMIYSEQHLTKAGERLKLTQPAMSNALTRLREMFDDPLFVRSGKQMLPTPRAQQVAPFIEEILGLAEQALVIQKSFSPQTSKRTFRLAMSDYAELVIFPPLFKWLTQEAPGIRIESTHLPTKDQHRSLESLNIDLMIGEDLSQGPTLFKQALFKDREVCMVREGHPISQEKLTLEKYLSLTFAQFQMSDRYETQVDRCLREQGHSREINLQVHHELILPIVLMNTEMAVNIPERMAQLYQNFMPLERLTIPLELSQFEVCQYWFERDHHSPAHQWLRSGIKTLCENL